MGADGSSGNYFGGGIVSYVGFYWDICTGCVCLSSFGLIGGGVGLTDGSFLGGSGGFTLKISFCCSFSVSSPICSAFS